MKQPLWVHVYIRSWKKTDLLKGIEGTVIWAWPHWDVIASENNIKLNNLKIRNLWLLWSETRDLCWCCLCCCCSAALASAVGMNWQQTIALPLHLSSVPHHCGITITGNYDIHCVRFWFVVLFPKCKHSKFLSYKIICHVNFVPNWSVTI